MSFARRSDLGSATPLSLMLGLSMIVLPVMLLVLTVPTWEQRAVDAQDAARNAARQLVVAQDWAGGVAAANQSLVADAANDGLAVGDLTANYSGSLAPGGEVTATVTITVPVGRVPLLGFVGTMHYVARSTEHVGSYRGLPS